MKNHNAIITGARSGIGLAVLKKFASLGVNCWAVVHREDEEFLLTISELEESYGVWIKIVNIDLSDSKSIVDKFKQITSEKLPIDILVNAAGVTSPARLFTMTKDNDFRSVMEVNFFAAAKMSQLVAKPMMRQRSGCIVNISSISADGNDSAQIEYACSKAAIDVLTKKLATELGSVGIRVNAVAPGLIDTKMLAGMDDSAIESLKQKSSLKRLGTPEEIADVCAFLASDEASFITGQVIRIDGGI